MTTKEKTASPSPPPAPAPDQAKAQGGGDHVESLSDIAKAGAQLELDESAPGAPGAPAAAPKPDPKAVRAAATAEISVAAALLRESAIPFAPPHVQDPLGVVWSDKQIEKIAAAIVDICVLNGWDIDDFFGTYGPYIQLLMALGIPLLATIKLLKVPAPGQAAAANGQQQ